MVQLLLMLIKAMVNLDFIIDERARIALEGHRRQDLICFNKYGGGSYNWAWKGNIANGTLELI
jgi:hypothetical protein